MRAVEEVILVDENDVEIGTMEKIEAHKLGKLHRAFSVFLFNDNGELLIHQRAISKYHCGGLWTNTCCSHPKPGESNIEAANRRLMEEMSISAPLHHAFSFVYRAQFDNGLTEHEFDHVFCGRYNHSADPNKDEVQNWKYESIDNIQNEVISHPEKFTPWFKLCFQKTVDYYFKNQPL